MQRAADTLQNAGIPDPKTDAALLLAHVTGLERLELSLRGAEELSTEQEQRLSSLLFSRASRRPLQYILGKQGFYGLSFQVDERVLVPRPETETLCEIAIAYLRGLSGTPRVLDLCTGSGAIAVTLAHECPTIHVTAADVSRDALDVAESNAHKNNVHIRFLQGDFLAPVTGERFHCITCNPPYIESEVCLTLQEEVLQEPLLALDGGADGLDFYRRLAKEGAAHLEPGGLLCMEIGATQGDAVCALLEESRAYRDITVHPDLAGLPRVVCARSSPT